MQPTTGRPCTMPGRASASACAPSGLWAASETSGGSPPATSMRPGSRVSAATASTSAGSRATGDRSAAATATARLPARYGARPASGRSARRLGGADHAWRRVVGGALGECPDLRVERAEDEGRVGLQDRQLLGGDLERGLPQVLGVLEADRGQGRHPRGDDVGRVEAPAEPGLDHRDLDARRGEGDEGRGRGRLELGHRHRPPPEPRSTARIASATRADGGPEAAPADLGAADLHPLGPALAMRREIRAGAARAARRAAAAVDHRHRGLAVGADDVDRGEPALGHAQLVEQPRMRSSPKLQPTGSSPRSQLSASKPRPPEGIAS